ncbi:hypothetical protein [Paenibacillus sp. HJGM_3]|uniref:hypothetical protein n=1 Tax=Paenibacillus sp. HJGM_3 TaxID=3379816 RepID=UPI0038682A08
MAVGTRLEGNVTSWIDPEFGYRIVQPMEQDHNRIMYFTSNCFCRDNQSLLISSVRDGVENFYKLNYEDGTCLQLTDEPGIVVSQAHYDKGRDTLYYALGHSIKSVHLETLESRTVYSGESACASIGVTCDGRYLISSMKVPYRYSGNDGEPREMQLYRLFKVELATGEWSRILDRSFELDHIQCSPTDRDWLLFCARGFYATHHRIWGTSLDGTRGGALGPEQPNEHRTHEYFTPDGVRIAYHGKFYAVGDEGRYKNIGHTWGSMNADGTDDRYYRCLHGKQAGHSSMSQQGRQVVADGNDYLSMVRLHEGTQEAEFVPLYRHGSSMKGNFVHAHPCFSNDDRYIAFCTDHGGTHKGNVYLLDLHSQTSPSKGARQT